MLVSHSIGGQALGKRWVMGLSLSSALACTTIPPCPDGAQTIDGRCVPGNATDADDRGRDDVPDTTAQPDAGRSAPPGDEPTSGTGGTTAAGGRGGMSGPLGPASGSDGGPSAGAAAGSGGSGGMPAANGGGGVAAPAPPPTCVADSESCDNRDNDCDGKIDESLVADCGSSSGLGECRIGTQTCVAGSWSSCAGEVKPQAAEVCDADMRDENCDGASNEGCACVDGATAECGKNVGICSIGKQTCTNGRWGSCTGARNPEPTEICDPARNDENCDGRANEGCECTGTDTEPCPGGSNVGECRAGTRTCSDGRWGRCSGYQLAAPSERCNGRDDDCDGTIDDNPTDCQSPNTCRGGACMCQPSCARDQCGTDGCGGRCPTVCGATQTCTNARCVNNPNPPPGGSGGAAAGAGAGAAGGGMGGTSGGGTCGNGKLDPGEECDPRLVPSSCNASCRRTVYQACSRDGDLCANDQLCTAFYYDDELNESARPVCARFCDRDSDCPPAPSGDAHQFTPCDQVTASCMLLCDDQSRCPPGLRCDPSVFYFSTPSADGRALKVCVSP